MIRLVKLSAPLALTCVLALTGCGTVTSTDSADAALQGTADAAVQGTPDAAPQGTPDAAPQGTPDAAPQGTPDAMTVATGGLGQLCSQTLPCPTDAPSCIMLAGGATQGICSETCGTTADTTNPPVGGNAVCAAIGSEAGTPACILSDGMGTWFCAVTCGTASGTDLGTCPAGTTCQNSACQP